MTSLFSRKFALLLSSVLTLDMQALTALMLLDQTSLWLHWCVLHGGQ